MDDYVKNVLVKWSLSDLIPRFKEEQVNSMAFQYLTDDMIKELVPRIGRRAIFRHKYVEFKRRDDKNFVLENMCTMPERATVTMSNLNKSQLSNHSNSPDVYVIDESELRHSMKAQSISEMVPSNAKRIKYGDVDFLQILNDDEMVDVKDEDILYEIEGSGDENLLLSSTAHTPSGLKITLKSPEPPTPNITFEKSEIEKPAQDLRAVLKESVVGRSLLEKKTLTSANRTQISDIIVQHLMNKSSDYRIRTVEFLYWANAIKLVFPYEAAETYYQPYKRDANTCARGKLFDKYHHVRRAFLPRRKLVPAAEAKQTVSEVISGSKDLVALKACKSLNEFKDLWPRTYDERQELLGKMNIIEYFDTFSILKTYNGIHMLKQDYNRNFEKSKDALTTKWPGIAKKILSLAQPKLEEITEQLGDDEMDIENANDHYLHYSFILLFFLMPPKKVAKLNWTPSKVEMIQSCFLYTKSFSSLQSKMTERKQKLNNLNLPILPLIGAIGESFGDLNRNFVIINNIFYEFPSLIDAIDACQKIFVALKSDYPPEGLNFWMFIQKCVYQIETTWEKNTMAIHCLWSDLEALQDSATTEEAQEEILTKE